MSGISVGVANEMPLFGMAAWVSIKILLLATVLSLALGLCIGQGLLSKRWYVTAPLRVWVDLFRLTPPLLQIVLIFFLLPVVTGMRLPAFEAGVIALSLNYSAFFSEVFRAGVLSLGRGQGEAGAAMGMTHLQVLKWVIYPQAIRRMLPPITNMLVNLTKDTSLLTIIGVAELFKREPECLRAKLQERRSTARSRSVLPGHQHPAFLPGQPALCASSGADLVETTGVEARQAPDRMPLRAPSRSRPTTSTSTSAPSKCSRG